MSDDVIECFLGDTTDIIELGIQTSKERVPPRVVAVMDANYTCKIAVGSVNRAVTDKTSDGKYFRGWLTPTETASLGVGEFKLGMQISNSTITPPFVKEKQFTLRILPQAVT